MSWIEYLKSVDTPTLSNAIELLDSRPRHEGYTPLEIRCLFPELGPMCGYALTAQVETVTRMAPVDRMTFVEFYQALSTAPKPAVIALQEIGGHTSYAAHCGELMATIFQRLGAVGLVSDSAVRDIAEVRKLKFHYFARGTVASHANFRIVRVGIPIQIEGLVIQPGDLLHGDENGLLLIPEDVETTLPSKVEQVRSRESTLLDYVRSPEFTVEGLRRRVLE